MNLTEEQLNEIETMAGLFFTLEEIMINIGISLHDSDLFTDIINLNRDHPASLAYNRGRISAETELRQSIKSAALNGSNPAQMTMLNFLNQTKS